MAFSSQVMAPLESRKSWVEAAQGKFQEAATLIPRAVDPHLGLARIYVYSVKNVGKAIAELHEAERLGFKPGPREMEQEADGYRFRAYQELADARKAHNTSRDEETRDLQLAQRDFDRARRLYEPIIGFSKVDVALREVDQDDRARQQLEEFLKEPLPVKRKIALRSRRWQ